MRRFGRLQREANGRPLTVDGSSSVQQAYAGVLKNGGFDRDAAWNYEYIARLRDAAAKENPRTVRQARSQHLALATAGPTVAVENRGGLAGWANDSRAAGDASAVHQG